MKKFLTVLLCIILGIGIICGGFALANKLCEGAMNDYIDSFEAVENSAQLIPEKDGLGNWYFTTDEDFKVMHLTDIHIGGGVLTIAKDKKAINAVAAMITAEKPDLVVITGDISFAVPWGGTINNRYAHRYFIRLMENLGVYWTVTFGNHDSEVYDYASRAEVATMYENPELKYCLFSRGPAEIYGECNHVINVMNSQGLVTKSLIMIDSNSYTDEDPLGINWIYDNIHEDQISWYRSVVERYSIYNTTLLTAIPDDEKPENIEDFTTVQSLLFMHIPPMEVRDAYNEYLAAGEQNTEDLTYFEGKVGESDPYVYCSNEEDMMFEAILNHRSTQAIFYGHDHLNNLVVEYKGITLSYGYSIDYFAYSGIDKQGSQRGCTVINCSPDTSFEIIHENYYQDKYPSKYEKETNVTFE